MPLVTRQKGISLLTAGIERHFDRKSSRNTARTRRSRTDDTDSAPEAGHDSGRDRPAPLSTSSKTCLSPRSAREFDHSGLHDDLNIIRGRGAQAGRRGGGSGCL